VVSDWARGDNISGVGSEYPVKYMIHRKCRFAVRFTAMVNGKKRRKYDQSSRIEAICVVKWFEEFFKDARGWAALARQLPIQ
jgi:hypothetical protein